MCGIIAIISKNDVRSRLLLGLRYMENRGYDSAGIALIENNKIENNNTADTNNIICCKAVEPDAIQKVSDGSTNMDGHVGIAHTRWATHGEVSVENSHPHLSYNKRFAIVHNGIIENDVSIRKMLFEKDIKLTSDTDSELIAHLLELSTEKNTLDKLKGTVSQLEGTWGVVVLDRDNPRELYAARKGSPLLIGLSEDSVYIGSELSGFSHSVNKYVELQEGEIVSVSLDTINDLSCNYRIIGENIEKLSLSPDPYAHWTLKEINEQSRVIDLVLNKGGRIKSESEVKLGGLERHTELLKIKDLIITGCGTSLNAGLFGSRYFRSISGFNTVQVIDSANIEENLFSTSTNNNNFGLLALSQSGETKDVIRAVELAKKYNVKTFSIINVVGSQIARLTECGVYLNSGREVGVAATKSFTAQCVALLLIAVWFSQKRDIHINERKHLIFAIDNLAGYIQYPINVAVHDTNRSIHKIIKVLMNSSSCFILGRGDGEAIAREGALKIKELTYVHAEAYNSASLKHGPLALITKNVPVFIIIMDDCYKDKNITALSEINTRGGYTIVITDMIDYKFNCNQIISVKNSYFNEKSDSSRYLYTLMSIVIFQTIAYKLAIYKDINPDKPRNLAKSVTVD